MELTNKVPQTAQILIIDDVPAALRVLKRCLSKLPFIGGKLGFTNIEQAVSGEEALEKIEKKNFDFVISDINLKDMTVEKILNDIRGSSKENKKKLPFIVVTSDMQKDEFIRLAKIGISGYLLKPYSPGDLVEKINEIYSES